MPDLKTESDLRAWVERQNLLWWYVYGGDIIPENPLAACGKNATFFGPLDR